MNNSETCNNDSRKDDHNSYHLNAAILEGHPDSIIFALDCNYCYLTYNRKHKEAMKNVWGSDIEIGMNMLDAIGRPQVRENAKMNFDRVMKGESFNLMEEYVDEASSRFYFKSFWAPIFSDNGSIIGLTCFILDISEKKKAEATLKEEMKFTNALFDSIPGYLYIYDEAGRLIKWNKKHEVMTGYTADELSQMTLDKWFEGEDAVNVAAAVKDVFETGYGEVEANLLTKGGGKLLIRSNGVLLEIDGKKYFTGVGIDISKQRENEEIIRRSEEKYRLITENISDVIWVLNISKNKFTYISPSIFQLRGLTPEEAINESMEEAFIPESLEIAREALIKNTNDFIKNPNVTKILRQEFKQPCKDGTTVWVEVTGRYRYNVDGDIELVGASHDIQERKMAEEKILNILNHDQLTGIYNRRFYEEELSRIDSEINLPIALIMVDVNGLKLINDAFGHQTGDLLLKKIADVLSRECNSDGIVSRIGGDEFILLLPRADAVKVNELIERINESIANEKMDNVIMSVAIGFALKYDSENDMHVVFKEAEDDLYRHKITESSSMRSKTIELIMSSLFEKNKREMLHSQRVGELCESIARSMNFTKHEINQMRIAGLMHDIGKIGIEDTILNKTSGLNRDEWDQIKRHSEIGYRILSSVNEFSEIANYVLEHQERWDGKGYPKGLKSEEISIQARIIAVADSYDAMTSDRAYRSGLSKEEAIREIIKYSGTQFDPDIVKVFVEKVLIN